MRLADGSSLGYDRLVLAPGIDLSFEALPGYDEAAAERCRMPGRPASRPCCCAQQLEAMDDGGAGGDCGARQSLALPAGAL